MQENYDLKFFSSPSFGPDALGEPILIKDKDEKWKNTSFVTTSEFIKNIENVKKFKVFEDDVFLLGYPRSGTTLMQEMIWLILNDFNFEKARSEVTDKRFPFFE